MNNVIKGHNNGENRFEIPNIENLDVTRIIDDIFHVSQMKSNLAFTKCDGLIIAPRHRRNSNTIVLDLNLEPNYIYELEKYIGPVSNYICTHGHLDHSAHVHVWEELGATIYAPYPHNTMIEDYDNLIENFEFLERVKKSTVKKFGRINGYQSGEKVTSFMPGTTLTFEEMEIKTIPLNGHTIGHIGFLLPVEKILHISCLGFDQQGPGMDGLGPWYGFKQCSISQYLKDIDMAEAIYREQAEYLTSSHSYVVSKPDYTPFRYMKDKINQKQNIIDNTMKALNTNALSLDDVVHTILEMDLFFPKKMMDEPFGEMFRFMEYWIIRKHVEMSPLWRNK